MKLLLFIPTISQYLVPKMLLCWT